MKDNNHYCEYFGKIIIHGFSQKITLQTRICKTTSILIENIFTNIISIPDSSAIMLNQISDHQMVFKIVKNLLYVTAVLKFIDIECPFEYLASSK